jgi:hypothetical protein
MTPDEQTISEILSTQDNDTAIRLLDMMVKKRAIAYGHWLIKRLMPHMTPVEPTQPEADDLYTLFLNHQ